MPTLRRLSAASGAMMSEDDAFRKELDSFGGQRDVVMTLRQQLLDIKRQRGIATKWVFLYSYTDDAWELLKL